MKDYFENLTTEDFIGKSCRECYNEYVSWCGSHNEKPINIRVFGTCVHFLFNVVSKETWVDTKAKIKTRTYVKENGE